MARVERVLRCTQRNGVKMAVIHNPETYDDAERVWEMDEAIEWPECIRNQVKPSKILNIASKLG